MGLGVVRSDLETLVSAFLLPDGYKAIAIQQDEAFKGTFSVLLESSAIPESQEGEDLPELQVLHTLETLPDQDPAYRKITGHVTILERKKLSRDALMKVLRQGL